MSRELSTAQVRCLAKLAMVPEKWFSAYELQEHTKTLDMLVRVKYAIKRSLIGSMFSPRTMIEFKVTPAGVAVGKKDWISN